ncbi:MAG: malectin domain-containing carbohydrate-binding protein, partial [Pricia sp.]
TLSGCPQTINLKSEGHNIDGDADIFFVIGTNYQDAGGLTSFDQLILHPKRKEAEFYDAESGTTIISNSDALEGGTEAVRVNADGFIMFEGRNLINMTAVKYRVLSDVAGNSIELRTGSPTGTLLATTQIPNTSNEWVNVQTPITDPGTTNDLYFVFRGAAGQPDIFDLNYVEFIGAGVSTDSTPPKVNRVRSASATQVTVEFSEYMNEASAELLTNYNIDNGVSISSAELLEDNRTVVLTTSVLDNDTAYSLNVGTVQNESGLPLVAANFPFSIFGEVRINVGGPQTLVGGQTFIADRYASGGNLFSNEIPIDGTTDDALYQTERFGTYSYEIPVSIAGDYDIRLHFAEIFYGAPSGGADGAAGSRVFNVSIEGNPVLTNFDILSETAAATALTKELDDIAISDGFASIVFSSVTESPKISGIEILSPDTFDGGGDTDADIIITSPSSGWNVNQPFEVAFRVENWTVNEGDTHLHYYVDGTLVDRYYAYEPIPIEGYSLGEHTIRVELFNADHTPTGIFDEVTVNITGEVTCNETPFPESWTVHELEENEYTVVYTFADYDLDGDGLKDIVTGGWWFKNPGTASGNWIKSNIGGVFGNVAHVYDFDGDGDLDLLGTTGRYTNAELVWAQNDGEGNFTVFENIPVGDTDYREPFLAGIAGGVFDVGGPYQMAINWNGAEETGSPVQMLTPSEDPTTGTWTLVDISQDSSGEDIQAGDIDQDNDLDLFQGVNWLRNEGNGIFTTFETGIDYNSTPDRAQLADFDRDGDLDAVVGQLGVNGSGNQFEFAWFESQDEDRTLPWTKNVLDTGIQGSLSVFATDLDFDGDKDIVVGEWRGEQRLLAFENDLCGSGEFTLRVLDDGGLDLEHHDGARVTDIDNDGDLDVISNGWLNNLVPRIYENTSELIVDGSPIADAGEDRTVEPGTEFTLTGTGSDPDGGDIASYLWSIQSSPEGDTASLSGADTTEVTVTNASQGTYVFRLTVTDDEGETGIDEVTITVGQGTTIGGGNVNRINAGGPAFTVEGIDWAVDQNFNGGSTFTNAIPIANTNNPQLYQTERFRPSGNGSLIYEIPVANGALDVNLHFAEIYFGVSGAGSTGGAGSRVFTIDVEGQRIENYDIFVAAGGAATAVIESFTGVNVTDESLTITLIPVTEFPKISGIEIIEPVVEGAPVADAGEDQEITLPENSIVLTGTGSDGDGGEVSFAWTQQSGPDATLDGANTAELSVSNMSPGSYVFRLTVTDDEGESDFDEVSVTVFPEGGILAVAEAAPTNGSAPLEVTFTGSNSMGDITSYLWDFKDGNTSTEADPANTFIAPGTYEVELTVTDAGGMSNTTTISIAVVGDEAMGVFLQENPPKDGIATIRVVNQPDNFMMLGVNVHDMQGRLLNSYLPEDIIVNDGAYQVPVHILRAGLYFFEIAMNQGKPVTLKVLIRN